MIACFEGEPIARLLKDQPNCLILTQNQLLEEELPKTEVLLLPEGYSVDEELLPGDLNAMLVGVSEVIAPLPERLPDGAFYFNGWPVPAQAQARVLEVVAEAETLGLLKQILEPIGITVVAAPAQAGMASARVVAMIINEAHLLEQEGAASAEDIDLSMKLGTGYPLGPFAWEQLWGQSRTRVLLEAMAEAEPDVVLPYWKVRAAEKARP